MTGYRQERTVIMSVTERRQYVRWWIECCGLTRDEVIEIALGIWSERAGSAERSARPVGWRPAQTHISNSSDS